MILNFSLFYTSKFQENKFVCQHLHSFQGKLEESSNAVSSLEGGFEKFVWKLQQQ